MTWRTRSCGSKVPGRCCGAIATGSTSVRRCRSFVTGAEGEGSGKRRSSFGLGFEALALEEIVASKLAGGVQGQKCTILFLKLPQLRSGALFSLFLERFSFKVSQYQEKSEVFSRMEIHWAFRLPLGKMSLWTQVKA